MSRKSVAVTLKSGAVHYVLVQNSIEFLDMQEALAEIGENEALKRSARIKAGISTKLSAGLCDPDGTLILADKDAALAFMATIQMRDVDKLVKAFNDANSLTDEAVENTEKK